MTRIIYLLLSFAFAVQAQESTASRQVITFAIAAPQLNASKKIWIYLPKNYTASRKRYPVIYMHDAQNLFDAKTSYVGEWNVDESLDSINAKVIIVGIEHGNEKRIDELTPFKNEKYGGGNADAYLDFIVHTLKPEIDEKYRTMPTRKHTAIMGSSLGGLVSFYAILKYSAVFGKAGVFSPSFWFTNDIYTLASQAKNIKAKIYFLAGDSESDDMISDLTKMESIVDRNRRGSAHLTKKLVVKGGKHNEKLWREHFLNAYIWLFL